MDQNLDKGGRHSYVVAYADSGENISDLCHGGVGKHTFDISLPQRIEGAEKHGSGTEQKKQARDVGGKSTFEAEYTVKQLDQQNHVAFYHQAGENAAG